MRKREDRNTRYFIDLDLETRRILGWDYDQRDKLVVQKLTKLSHHRVFVTKGQFNKLEKKELEILGRTARET
jgi:hypothetical protein